MNVSPDRYPGKASPDFSARAQPTAAVRRGRVCFALVLYRSPVEKLDRLFASLAGLRFPYGLHVYDNSPTNRLGPMCRRAGAVYTHDPRNIGFGAANNCLLRRTLDDYAYHIVLNPDIYFDARVIGRLLHRMDRAPDVVQLMPRIAYPDGSDQGLLRRLPRPLSLFSRAFTNRHRTVSKAALQRRDTELFFSGCFMCVRTAALRRTSLFDERFFLYFEDVDLCRQLATQGRQLYWPMVTVTHDWSGGSTRRWRLLYHHFWSYFQYFNKYGWRPLW